MAADLLSLDASRATDPALAGGKAASLARLRRAGLPVPAGVVLTTAAFRRVVLACGAPVPPPGAPWTAESLAAMRERLMAGDWPRGLEVRLLERTRALSRPFAVRSSMVSEDAAAASWAGQLESVLDVAGDRALLAAVRTCFASRFQARVLAYARGTGRAAGLDPLGDGALAVLVQEMAPPGAAGVAFSADPQSGRRCVVVEAATGRGDRVVSGHVVPDRFVVDERGVVEDSRPAQPGTPVLPEAALRALAELVRECERIAGAPQDVEWAWDGARPVLLQSRPITTLLGRHVYSNRLTRDWTPGLVPPLLWSTNSLGMTRTVFRRVFTHLLGPHEFDYDSLIRRVHSRIYADVTVIGGLLERAGFPPNAFEWMVRGERARFRPPRLTPRLALAAARFARFAWRHSRLEREITRFVDEHARHVERFRATAWERADDAALAAAIDTLLALHGRTQWYVWVSALNLHLRARLLEWMLRRHAPAIDVKDLLRGLREAAGASPERELERVARAAPAMEGSARALMLAGDDAAVRACLAESEPGRALTRDVDALLERFGHLSVNGTDFSRPTWAERPGQVWAALARHAVRAASPTPAPPSRDREVVARMDGRFASLKRRVFAALLRSSREWTMLRERTSLLMSRDAAEMRRVFLEHGRRLAASGALDGRDDVFLLTLDELRDAASGRRAPEATRALARRSRREMEEDALIEPEDTLVGEQAARTAVATPTHQEYLVGIAASPGVRRGTARLVRDPADVRGVLTVEDVLVTPFTDAGWTPLFAEVGAVVSEAGGQLSHAAIVAREYGLPAVVSVRGALSHIRDGQRIIVDGGAGRVYLHDRADMGRES